MTLSGAWAGAVAGLSVSSTQISVVSRNIANQSNASASRKIANVVTSNGLPVVASISQVSNDTLLTSLYSANGQQAQQSAISSALTQLEQTLGTSTDNSNAPTTLLGVLADALQTYAAAPQTAANAEAAVSAAQNLANALNSASQTVQSVREQADSNIADSVDTINSLLGKFETVNQAIVTGTQSGADITDSLDERNSLLQQLSSQIGITTITRSNNDMAIYTDSGVTLFDKTPRSVSFTPNPGYSASTQGNAVYADGVPITDSSSTMATKTGALAGYVKVRDTLAVTYQTQLDEIARGLITDFQETDQSATPTAPDQAGLFTNGSNLAVASTLTPGLASTITVASSAVSTPTLVRDGGISGSAYVYNTTGASGYSTRLTGLLANLSDKLTFDASAGAGTSATVADFASSSASWLGNETSQASTAATYSTAVQNAASTALSNATGINLDTEMSNMLALEQSYQASSKILNTIDALYASLFAAIQ